MSKYVYKTYRLGWSDPPLGREQRDRRNEALARSMAETRALLAKRAE